MNLDKYGLPVQADGDANDQLQRVGMIFTASAIIDDVRELKPLEAACAAALKEPALLQPQPGIFVRYVGGDPDTVSADQLISALGAFISVGSIVRSWPMFTAMLARAGFAQNTKDGLSGSTKTKIPDFMLTRALPLFARMHWSLYPLCLLSDILLVGLAFAAVGPVWRDGSWLPSKRSPDDVDHNNTILTLAVCASVRPTPLSAFARFIFRKLLPWNYGCQGQGELYGQRLTSIDPHKFSPVYGALRWYHRAESGGNPEIAEMWKPIIDKYFGGST